MKRQAWLSGSKELSPDPATNEEKANVEMCSLDNFSSSESNVKRLQRLSRTLASPPISEMDPDEVRSKIT